MSRSRAWSFTLNNYTDDEIEVLDNLECQYIVYGKELAPETQTPHLQGFVYFPNAKTMTAIKKKIGNRAHLEVSRGTPSENRTYCIKDGDFVERGELPQQGQRTDIQVVRDVVNQGKGMRAILDEEKVTIPMIKIAEKYLTYKEKPRNWKPYVWWIWGPTGSGKSRRARELLGPEPFEAMETNQWWDGYDAHADVIIDDMRGDFAKFHVLLKLLDRYGFRVQIKGGYRQFLAKRIVITSCYHPTEMFSGRTTEDIGQLLRRIDEIEYIGPIEMSLSI